MDPNTVYVSASVTWHLQQPVGSTLLVISPTFSLTPFRCTLVSVDGEKGEDVVISVKRLNRDGEQKDVCPNVEFKLSTFDPEKRQLDIVAKGVTK